MKVAIIGGGAAGLFLAKKLSEDNSIHVIVFEKSKKIGTKIKASCGGKANILNRNIQPFHYNNPAFMEKILQKASPAVMQQQFDEMGLKMVADDEGRLYPSTLFSQTVVDVLTEHFSKQVRILTEYPVHKIISTNYQWQVENFATLFDKVVIATGSPAGMLLKNQQGYHDLTTHLKLKFNTLTPSLVGFKLQNHPAKLFGCRTKAIVTLGQNDHVIHREKGEVIFKEDGISGIVILNCSAYYNRLECKNDCWISLDFLYDDENYNLQKHWEKHHSFTGLLHPKLNELYQSQPFDLKNFKFDIAGTYDMDSAQVAHGGIDLDEINEHFQWKKNPSLFINGEALDIDGVCGGYNLYFAFASAYLTAQYILNENSNH